MSKVVLQPLTRVEGHGTVALTLQGGRLREVRVALNESPRLFEKLVVGRSAGEVPDLICRICAICSAVHKLAALAAIERAMAIEIPPAARLVRELLLLGGHIQSHALHLFCLILPDFANQPSVLELIRTGDPLAIGGVELKALGNRLQEIAGGRVIHPVNAVLGGVVRCPAATELTELQRTCEGWLNRWPQLADAFAEAAVYPPAGSVAGTPLATGADGHFALTGDRLLLPGAQSIAVADYAALLGEVTVTHSRARHSFGLKGPFLVGALARRRLWSERSAALPDPTAAGGIHANNAAQVAEIGRALDRIREILEELQRLPAATPLVNVPGPLRAGIGTAAFEAPRGLLVHHYVVDDWGRVAAADIVTPTAINQRVMERQLLDDLAGIDDETILRGRAERIVRAYDPCISCAVHIVNCMEPSARRGKRWWRASRRAVQKGVREK